MDAKDSRPSWADFWKRYILSVMAASVAETVTFPLDLTKTRMQIQGLEQYLVCYTMQLIATSDIIADNCEWCPYFSPDP